MNSVNEDKNIGDVVVDRETGHGQRFTITKHSSGYYCVSIPGYEGGEVVKAEAHDALARVTLEWIMKFKELDHRIFHPNDTRDFRDCSEETCREATALVVQLNDALHAKQEQS